MNHRPECPFDGSCTCSRTKNKPSRTTAQRIAGYRRQIREAQAGIAKRDAIILGNVRVFEGTIAERDMEIESLEGNLEDVRHSRDVNFSWAVAGWAVALFAVFVAVIS